MKVNTTVKALGAVAAVGAAATAYALAARPRMLRWGVRPGEVERIYPGDEFVLNPQIRATHAVTVHAPPEKVFPWLLQLGAGRGGFYSYEPVEQRLLGPDIHDADHILPEYQSLKIGDPVPFAEGIAPRVALLEANHHLVLRGTARGNGEAHALRIKPGENFNMTWGFFLEPLENGDTRLIERLRIEYSASFANNALYYGFVEPGAFFMERAMLLGIKARAEGDFGKAQERMSHRAARARESQPGEVAPEAPETRTQEAP